MIRHKQKSFIVRNILIHFDPLYSIKNRRIFKFGHNNALLLAPGNEIYVVFGRLVLFVRDGKDGFVFFDFGLGGGHGWFRGFIWILNLNF